MSGGLFYFSENLGYNRRCMLGGWEDNECIKTTYKK